MTKGDKYTKELIRRILREGCLDEKPTSRYSDGKPAHTLSINHVMCSYDLDRGDTPLITLRPIAFKSAIGEILWIYQDASNNLDVLKDKYGVTWWDQWDLGDRTIGSVYGETIRRHDLVNKLLDGIRTNPDGRRHIISMWQYDDFEDPHGLKPCAYQTAWNVRHSSGIDYLDMCLYQRSSDFLTAGCINQVQYCYLLLMIARELGYRPGKFTWFVQNMQIYDRHVPQAREMLARSPIECRPLMGVNLKRWGEYTPDDSLVEGYPIERIKLINPQLKFELAEEKVDTLGVDATIKK